MQLKSTILFLFLFSLGLNAQGNLNIDLRSNVPLVGNERGNDIWGFVDSNGTEYAILGTTQATKIYSLEDPSAPIERKVIPGSNSVWRDMKTQGNYIYVTTDDGIDGLLIIDMTDPMTDIPFKFWQPQLTVDEDVDVTLTECHNIYIDENGVAYLAGCNVGEDNFGATSKGGVIFLDITTDPMNPVMLGYQDERYSHDIYVRDDILYSSEIYKGEISMYDISDKTNPIYLGGAETTSSFTHNAWISDDSKYIFTTDERPNGFVDAYDISDFDDIRRVDQFQPFAPDVDSKVIPHNTHYHNGFVVTSWYTDGVVITDVSNPDIMIKTGFYDTFTDEASIPANSQWFEGCWGAYPYLPSGLLLASDINTGLYVFQPTYKHASFLRGIVTNSSDGSFINGVEVKIDETDALAYYTDPAGVFGAGSVNEGTVDVIFTHPDYHDKVVSVDIASGMTTMIDVEMDPLNTYQIDGVTIRSSDSGEIPNAQVIFINSTRSVGLVSDGSGEFSSTIVEDTYDIYAGAWGYHQLLQTGYQVSDNAIITLELDRGYQDDFFFDFQWNVTADASTGAWVRDVPVGTFAGNGSTVNPSEDVPGDLGDLCYMTGNGGGGAGSDDIDDGETVLTSPAMDLTIYTSPILEYRTWFVNRGGSPGEPGPNDSLHLYITNGAETVRLETINDDVDQWRPTSSFILSEHLAITDEMYFIARAGDYENGHITEAGLDQFFVREGEPSSTTDIDITDLMEVLPNPFNHEINVRLLSDSSDDNVRVSLYNLNGSLILDQFTNGQPTLKLNTQYIDSGMYFLVVSDQNNRQVQKLIKG